MPPNPALSGAIRPFLRGGAVDEVIAELAARQHDVVARSQLLALGVSEDSIKHRLAARRLRRILRGVYTTSHAELSRPPMGHAPVGPRADRGDGPA
jgi:hypothetical protein